MAPSRRVGTLLVQIVWLMLVGLTPLLTDALRLSDFFPFGPDYDEALPTGDNPTVTVDLAQPIRYFGQDRVRIIVSEINTQRRHKLYLPTSYVTFMMNLYTSCTAIMQYSMHASVRSKSSIFSIAKRLYISSITRTCR